VQLLRHHAVSLSMHGRFQLKTAAPLALFWKIILLFSGFVVSSCCSPDMTLHAAGVHLELPLISQRGPAGGRLGHI